MNAESASQTDSVETPATASTAVATDIATNATTGVTTPDWIDAAVAGLVRLLDDPSPQVRATALGSLKRLNDAKSATAVNHALDAANKSRDVLSETQREKK